MRIGYKRNEDRLKVEQIEVPQDFVVEIEKLPPSLEEMTLSFRQAAERGEIPRGIGGSPPEGWIDLGRFVLSIISSQEFLRATAGAAVGRVIGDVAWGYIKRIYRDIVRKTDQGEANREAMVIVTDEATTSQNGVSLVFILNNELTDEELSQALSSLEEARTRILAIYDDDLVNLDLENSDVIEVRFVLGRWLIERKNVVEYREPPRPPSLLSMLARLFPRKGS